MNKFMVLYMANGAEFEKMMKTSTPEQQKKFSDWLDPIAQAATVNEDPLDPDNDTIYHGTIVYVLTFDSGFRLVYSDTAGVLSGGERVLADSIHVGGGKIDLAILGYEQGRADLQDDPARRDQRRGSGGSAVDGSRYRASFETHPSGALLRMRNICV